ncbi:hypothetical protein AVEN_216864-1 [Araneus ventricosus]|uniref:Uncharacterized protein n=1 Tax=Araneus ventricosus TaxID=182803 RepID=A0A4Y2GCH4_ARAVE|nr:hypothetical protein AVEN_216864-1 [Araneus ventricosus]
MYSAHFAPKAVTIASISYMNKDEKMKILDDTIHILKISNSQNQTSHHLTKKLVGESNSFVFKIPTEKEKYKNDKLPEGPKAPRSPKDPGARSHKYTSLVQKRTKEFQIVTENDSSDRRQNLITPNSCAKTRWRRNNPVEKFELKN